MDKKDCEMFTSWRVEGTNYRFEVGGRLPSAGPIGHVSVGLSFDDKMVDFGFQNFTEFFNIDKLNYDFRVKILLLVVFGRTAWLYQNLTTTSRMGNKIPAFQ